MSREDRGVGRKGRSRGCVERYVEWCTWLTSRSVTAVIVSVDICSFYTCTRWFFPIPIFQLHTEIRRESGYFIAQCKEERRTRQTKKCADGKKEGKVCKGA
jgi:hypothetical protein